jgi:hypothetical protein
MFIVLAREDNLLFDRAYAENMKLPFDRGWDHWEVYSQNDASRDLHFLGEFKSYEDVEAFLTKPVEFHPVPTGIFQ